MHSKNGERINDRHRERFAAMARHGCICCKKLGINRYAEIHHIVEGRKRLGHDYTIPLCSWHHRGVPASLEMRKSDTEKWLGPSLAESKKSFVREFGSEHQLLMEIDQWLLAGEAGETRAQAERVTLPF